MKGNNEILVSVFVPTYNHGKYIKKTLDSIVMQKTDFRFEIIIHDDKSTDNTLDICREYKNKYPELIDLIIENENQFSKGNYRAIEELIKTHSQGKYVAMCEGDDYWIDELKLQKQIEFLENNSEYSFVSCPAIKINANGNPLESVLGPIDNTDRDITLDNDAIVHYPTASRICRKDIFFSLPSWYYKCGEAGDYVLQLYMLVVGKGYYMADIMSAYRVMTPGSSNDRLSKLSGEERKKYYLERQSVLMEVDSFTDFKHHKGLEEASMKLERNSILCDRNMCSRFLNAVKALHKYRGVGLKKKVLFFLACVFPYTYHRIAIKTYDNNMENYISTHVKKELLYR